MDMRDLTVITGLVLAMQGLCVLGLVVLALQLRVALGRQRALRRLVAWRYGPAERLWRGVVAVPWADGKPPVKARSGR
jgi:hypothetical protein